MIKERKAHNQARGALWASISFYVLIAFEFFYMASPFAAYLYAVYGPGLDWLQASSATSWAPPSIKRSARSDLPAPGAPRSGTPLPSRATQLA